MLNNLIKLLLDTNRLCLDSMEYDKSIPIETNPELNELEIKLRKELAHLNGRVYTGDNEKYLYYYDFEPRIINRFAKYVIFPNFPIINKNTKLEADQAIIWPENRKFAPLFFPNWTNADEEKIRYDNSIREIESEVYGPFGLEYSFYSNHPDKLYIGENDIELLELVNNHPQVIDQSNMSHIKMKKHRSKKWRNGKKK